MLDFLQNRGALDMNDKLGPMFDATRLTREGRLVEATELLQRLLRGDPPAPQPSGSETSVFGHAASSSGAPAPGVIDVTPQKIEEPGSRPAAARKTGVNKSVTGWAGRISQPHMPEALRDFLRQVNRIDPDGATPGLLRRSRARAPDLTTPDGAQFVVRSYSNRAGTRAYKLYIPSGYHGQALPLVVMLHGCTQTPDDFAAGTRMNALAEEHACFVAYPAQDVSANPSKCWNWFTPGNQRRDEGEPSLIAGITRQIMSDYAVDPQRVYAAGLSAGAAEAAIMGVTYPDLYAAIGVHSGLACGAASDLPSAFAAMRRAEPVVADVLSSLVSGADSDLISAFAITPSGKPARFEAPSSNAGAVQGQRMVPTIVFHGDQDNTVHARNADQVIAQSKTAAAMELHTKVERGQAPGGLAYSRTLHSDASGQAVLEQWVIHGAGHAWSGGSHAGSYTDPRGPNASREMLRFFLEHSHPAPIAP
jgi:poly(hydroxyalkanoate) depolymerase family esterase